MVRNNILRRQMRVALLILSILLSFLVFTGCSLHKSRITRPLIEVPSSYSDENENPAPQVGKWWEQFEDEQLNTLMEEAFMHNLDIAQAYERLQQSMAAMRITDSSRGLILNIEGSGGRARKASSLGPITEDTYTLSAAANYELDLWGKLKSNTEAALFDALATEQDLKTLYISISAQLADLYFLAIEQRAQLVLSDQTIASFEDTLERVDRRYRAGLVPAIDVYQSRQNLASAKAQRPLFESRLSTTINALSVLIGVFPDKETAGSKEELVDAPLFAAGIPSQLIARRPDIKAAFLRLKSSNERIASAIADRFPSFNLIGSYGGSSDEVRTILDSPNIFWNIILQAVQPILDAGRKKAEVNRTEAIFRENLATYHKTVLNAFKDVEDAIAKIEASEERIKALYDQVDASDSSLRLALDRYMQGLTDYLPVLTEQLRHFSTRSNLLAARRQLMSDRIQLARALGGEWMDDIKNKYLTTER